MSINIPPEIALLAVGVALGADPHVPALLTHEFLTEKEIVPKGWVAQDSISSAHGPRSQISYENVIFQLNEDVLKIIEQCGPGFENDYDIFDFALSYLDESESSYHTVGLNMSMCVENAYPSEWIGSKFCRKDRLTCFPNTLVTEMVFRFSLDEDQETQNLFINFGSGSINRMEQESRQAVVINSGVVLKSTKVSTIKGRISKWREAHDLILSHLKTMISED